MNTIEVVALPPTTEPSLSVVKLLTKSLKAVSLRRSSGALKTARRPSSVRSSRRSSRSSSSRVSSQIHTATAVVAVIGVGYVGLGLVKAFSSHYRVIAVDVSAERIRSLEREWSHLGNVEWTTEAARMGSATHILVAVPTLLKKDKKVDTKYVHAALSSIKKHAQPGSTIVMESSVAVGMTRKMLGPVMERKGFKGGMSPERVDPGRKIPSLHRIPKVISGLDDISPGSLQSIQDLYAPIFESLVATSSPEVAEMTKLYENCQRMMAISFANEMADACASVGIDAYEVAAAAATKPFGYLPVNPGMGVGGHCIPVNPYYLLETSNFPLLRAATEAAERRPAALGDRLMKELLTRRPDLSPRLARVLVVGLAFKPGESLTTNSPGVALLHHLQDAWGVPCQWYDPLVEEDKVRSRGVRLRDDHFKQGHLERFDMIVVAMRQREVDWTQLEGLEESTLIETFCRL